MVQTALNNGGKDQAMLQMVMFYLLKYDYSNKSIINVQDDQYAAINIRSPTQLDDGKVYFNKEKDGRNKTTVEESCKTAAEETERIVMEETDRVKQQE